MSKGFVYILRGLKNNKLYVGSTTDIEKRLKQHQSGYVIATKGLRPLKCEFFQEFETFAKARQAEDRLKSLKRKDYLERIIQDRCIKLGL